MRSVVVLLLIAMLAGCVGSEDSAPHTNEGAPAEPTPETQTNRGAPGGESAGKTIETTPLPPDVDGPPGDAADATLRRGATANWEGDLALEVPLEVILVGFPETAGEELQSRFNAPYGPNQKTLNSVALHDIDDARFLYGGYTFSDLPFTQQANVEVHVTGPDVRDSYAAAVIGLRALSEPFDGSAAQPWADDLLLDLGLDPLAPALVLVHLGTTGHTYEMQYANGVYEQARVFGGSGKALVMDLSAAADDFAGDEEHYMEPVATDDIDALELAIHDAIRFRLLQPPIYSIPTAKCHAITLLYAVHVTGEQGLVSSMKADDAVDVGLIKAAFDELTGEEVHVDLVRLDLPQDDAELWSLVRQTALQGWIGISGIDPGYVASSQAEGMVRAWIDANWETYHVDHAGCEEYLSLLVYSDALEPYYRGIAQYDEGLGHRYSFSVVPEGVRGNWEGGMLPGVRGTCCKSDTDSFQLVNMLFAHETGHLFGQAHPHNTIDDENDGFRLTFSTTRTVMSYLVDEYDVSFGTLDQENWHRNRIGYYAQELEEAGLKDAAIDAGFLAELEDGDWPGAAAIAQGLLA